MAEVWSIALVLLCSILGAFGPIYLKKGTHNFKILEIYKNFNLIYGIFLYGISILLFIVALTGGEVSVLYPIVASSYIWVAFLSKYYLNETMTKTKWKGIFFIIAGVILLAIGI